MNNEMLAALQDFAEKSSGDRKTQVAACLVWPDGREVFGANRLKDNHRLSEDEITNRVTPKFYDAMCCSEAEAIDRATQLGLDTKEAVLYSLMFPCPRCAKKIVGAKIKKVVAQKHRVNRNGKFNNPFEDSKKIFDNKSIQYDPGWPETI